MTPFDAACANPHATGVGSQRKRRRAVLGGLAMAAANLVHAQPTALPTIDCKPAVSYALPVTQHGEQAWVDTAINGHPVQFLIDTGAWKTSVLRSAVERFKLRLRYTRSTHAGVGGQSPVYVAHLDRLDFGKVQYNDLDVAVLWDSPAWPFDGLLGADWLMQHDLELDWSARHFELRPPPSCAAQGLARWGVTAHMVPLHAADEGDRRPRVTIYLNGERLTALIDTGATRSAIDSAVALRLGFDPGEQAAMQTQRGVGQQSATSWRGRFKRFAIGPYRVEGPVLQVMALYGAVRKSMKEPAFQAWRQQQPDLILGADFLQGFKLWLSMREHRLYFAANGRGVLGAAGKPDDSPEPTEPAAQP